MGGVALVTEEDKILEDCDDWVFLDLGTGLALVTVDIE
jgi:hypothetical protein